MNLFQRKRLEYLKKEANREVKKILDELEKDYPGITEGAATALGATTGSLASLGALYFLGTTGLSASGITSALAAAGMGGG